MTDTVALLREFHGEKLAMLRRHEAAARLVGQYDANNTYQFIINREEVQLTWVAQALAELGEPSPDASDAGPQAPSTATGGSQAPFAADARDAQAFVDRWRARTAGMTNARCAKMLQIILGETLEQKRFFDQALAGRLDLLGRRGEAAGARVGSVMAERWIE